MVLQHFLTRSGEVGGGSQGISILKLTLINYWARLGLVIGLGV